MVGPDWLSRRSRSIFTAAVFLLAGIAQVACRTDRTPELLGTWQAVLLIEEQDTVDVKLDDVGLYFSDGDRYVMTSTLDYVESGTFKLDGDYLLTTPSNQDTLSERTVEIAKLDGANLHINMEDGGKARRLEFVRVTEETTPSEGQSAVGSEGAQEIKLTHDSTMDQAN